MGPHSLALHTRKIRECEIFDIGNRTKWQVHKHFMNKSLVQTKQCKWLMEPMLGVTNLLWIHYIHMIWIWEETITNLIIIYSTIGNKNYIKLVKMPKFLNVSFKIPKLWAQFGHHLPFACLSKVVWHFTTPNSQTGGPFWDLKNP
jgi:hypothetical protein